MNANSWVTIRANIDSALGCDPAFS